MRALLVVTAVAFAGSVLAAPGLVVEVNELKAPRAPPAPSGERKKAHEEAREIMGQRCALCHGATGRSDGVMSSALKPRPRDFSDVQWQRSASDGQLRKAILEGGAAVGKSAIMPANPDLKSKPVVLDELVGLIRSFGRRGVVRAVVVNPADDAVVARSLASPDESGQKATLRFEGVPAGAWSLRGYFDANESGARDPNEPALVTTAVVVKDAPVTVEVKLSPAGRRP